VLRVGEGHLRSRAVGDRRLSPAPSTVFDARLSPGQRCQRPSEQSSPGGEDELVVEELRRSPTPAVDVEIASRPRLAIVAPVIWCGALRIARESGLRASPSPTKSCLPREQCACISRMPLRDRGRFQRLGIPEHARVQVGLGPEVGHVGAGAKRHQYRRAPHELGYLGLNSPPPNRVPRRGLCVLREPGAVVGVVWPMDRAPNTPEISRDQMRDRVDNAELVYGDDPSTGNKDRLCEIQPEYIEQPSPYEAASCTTRTGGSRPELVDRGER